MGEVVKAAVVRRGGSMGNGEASPMRSSGITEMVSAIARIESTAKAAAIDLALLMAERIVLTKVEMDPSVLNTIYAKALESAQGLEGAMIRVHPLDRASGALEALVLGSGFSIGEDAGVGRGGCRISARGLEVDASIETLLAAFEHALTKAADVPV